MYDRTIDGKPINLRVSGKLWNRSLIMSDVETNTEWSHLLGKAMAGPHKGKQLKALSGVMTTWAQWKQQHPKTTVLDLSRTMKRYNSEVYRKPERYVLGWTFADEAHHVGYDTLAAKPLMNLTTSDFPVLVSYDKASTAARIFSRELGDQVLTFEAIDGQTMRDKETESTWSRQTGEATAGKLKGKALKHHAGIPSYTRAWQMFHPESKAHGQ